MKDNLNESKHYQQKGLIKGLLLGPIIGAVLGFLILFIITGKLPFSETYSMGLGDTSDIIAIFYLFSIIGGAGLGLLIGSIIGGIIDYSRR